MHAKTLIAALIAIGSFALTTVAQASPLVLPMTVAAR
jgi:hypothetical protein